MDGVVFELVMVVGVGNPGALTIIRELMGVSTWYPLLHHLKQHGLVGSTLWRVVKDDYCHDITQFVASQLLEMGRIDMDVRITMRFDISRTMTCNEEH